MFNFHADPLLAAVWSLGTVCAVLVLLLAGLFLLDQARYARYLREDYYRRLGYTQGYLAGMHAADAPLGFSTADVLARVQDMPDSWPYES